MQLKPEKNLSMDAEDAIHSCKCKPNSKYVRLVFFILDNVLHHCIGDSFFRIISPRKLLGNGSFLAEILQEVSEIGHPL